MSEPVRPTPEMPEVVIVHSRRGHPKVWLEMGAEPFVECGYCDRRFMLATGDEGAEHELTAPGVYEGSHGH
jgi:hypothetical protein